jgi:hypothetical protein
LIINAVSILNSEARAKKKEIISRKERKKAGVE